VGFQNAGKRPTSGFKLLSRTPDFDQIVDVEVVWSV
jgi:hypothetical protein